jgi:hypothetical protein
LALAAGLAKIDTLQAQAKPAPQKKVYKWVDENGEVHYGESLPPDFEDKKADILDSQGITRQKDVSLVPPPPKPKTGTQKGELPRDKSGLQRPEPLYTEQEMKVQQDTLLLLRYDSDQEIVDAMEVEIKQLDYDRRLITGSISSLYAAYDGNIREAAERQRAGLAVEPTLIQEIQSLKSRVAKNELSLAKLEQREQDIRTSFQAELEHYRKLVAKDAPN